MVQNQPSLETAFDDVGGGAPSFNFPGPIGNVIQGTITNLFLTVVTEPTKNGPQPKLRDKDDPNSTMPQINITLQTELTNWAGVKTVPTDDNGHELPGSDDDGTRRIYAKYDMRRAIGEALTAAGVPKGTGLKLGGVLAVKHDADRDTGQINKLPLYKARYTAPEPKTPQDDAWDVAPPAQQQAPASQFKPVASDAFERAQEIIGQNKANTPPPAADPWAVGGSEPPF